MLLALMAALAADMTLSFHSQLQRTRQVNHHLQRQYDIELAEKLALASLTQDVKDNDRQTTLQQYWAQPQQLQLEDGNTVKWQLRDAQHCFNLNALAKISDDPLASPDFPAQVFSALLINAGSWTLVNQQTSWLIRSAAHAFNELDEHWLQHLAAQFPPENMLCYGVVPHGVAAANPLIQHPEIPSLSLYSADIAFQRYDMLHGIFRKQKTVSKSGKWLARLAVSCLVLAILSFVGSRSIALWHTLKIEDQLQQQQQETWQRYFPQIKRTHNFRFYFKQQLAQQYPEAVPLLYHLQTLLLEHPELQLMEANYSQKQKSLTLKMSAKSEANIDRFCELTQSWLPMEKTEKDPVSGVWTVRNSGK
ncbi:TPA: type II secretion system protein GspL [Escherichia coli]|nr:type II secretion system protein GspL [Escherichia coli]HAW6398865.1 type II secretion system protein GspL [Escherichia coli]